MARPRAGTAKRIKRNREKAAKAARGVRLDQSRARVDDILNLRGRTVNPNWVGGGSVAPLNKRPIYRTYSPSRYSNRNRPVTQRAIDPDKRTLTPGPPGKSRISLAQKGKQTANWVKRNRGRSALIGSGLLAASAVVNSSGRAVDKTDSRPTGIYGF